MSSYLAFLQLPPLDDINHPAHTAVLVADSRVDRRRVRTAVDAVFVAHPALGTA